MSDCLTNQNLPAVALEASLVGESSQHAAAGITSKICTRCHKDLPLNQFYVRAGNEKYRSKCKACYNENLREQFKIGDIGARRLASVRRYNNIHREKVNQGNRLRRLANPEKVNAQARALRKKNPERFRDYTRRYYRSHRESVSVKGREWRKRNVSKIRAYTILNRQINGDVLRARSRENIKNNPGYYREYARRRRALILGVTVGDSKVIVKWEKSWKKKKLVVCFWCRESFSPKRCNTDHIFALIKGGPHEIGNLCISCERCNKTKNSKLLKEWNGEIKEPALL